MELKSETRRLQHEIDKINRALTEEEKNAVLLDPDDMDPMGYTCTKEVLELNEITYLDQLLCFNTTEEQCYKVHYDFEFFSFVQSISRINFG